ncbi:glycine cleavage system aminomethyltransferase GcvT [Methylobacter sp. YRD-M1]|uniref:glycine cleavage system aminomethyltransferase GcvT n=1 Tax=Methylobacter sp. YRD-M1 TaxID=2911520 RepID=UPI00227B6931|nr:glycine cleavage system aminomethyltransferase GcvT [Methylobacter sp. YRD-M1]WAK00703.1 glycine cleavage system aminomethyltransferase GcvT [Methylobacter sp. YRD-M1]
MTTLKQTQLYSLHLERGAKMVPFAGYRMPVHYRNGTLHEHLHCRNYAGFFDISHMGQCLILGDSAAGELETLTPSDITGLVSYQQRYTVLTNDVGGIIDDIIVTRQPSGCMVIVNAACREKDFRHFKTRLSGRCHFKEMNDQALFALQGPAAATVMQKFSEAATGLSFMQACEDDINGIRCIISRSGYTGEDGFEISVAGEHADYLARLLLAEEAVEPIGLGARDSLRLEAGLCLYGHELDESITPVEAGLRWLIKKGHDQFPGADRILAQLKQGTEKSRVGLLVESKIPAREGCIIADEAGEAIGHVTSGGFSPNLGRPIAMAMLHNPAPDSDRALYARVRDHQLPVTITELPFIPHRYRR